MPFKSGQNFTAVNKKLDKVAKDIDGRLVERGLYVAATVGAGYAAIITPIDTSNLINSQYISQPMQTIGGTFITVGYSANYASAIHNFKGNPTPSPRPNGNGLTWDPQGEPFFLLNGFEQHMSEVNDAFFRAIKL